MRPLADRYEAFLLDLDGVLYRGDEALPGAAGALAELRARGRRIAFLTNNSARTPEGVAEKLTSVGIPASPDEVVTSALVTAERIRGAVASAYVIGEAGLRAALAEAGIEVLGGEPERADAVVIGWDRSVDYDRLRVAAVLVGAGARLVATNTDASYPAPGGQEWPGAGAIVAAVETATGMRAESFGKPAPALFEAAMERVATRRALVVGDRLETDVAGAVAAGLDAALVLTGAATIASLAEHDALPVAVLDDAMGVLEPRPLVRVRPARGDEATRISAAAGLAAVGGPEEALVGEDEEALATASVAVEDDTAYMHSVAVNERVRGLHLGALLAGAALRRAAARGAGRVVLMTEDAAGFFGHLGFTEAGREDLPGWVLDRAKACSAGAVAMERPLSTATRAGR